MRPAYLAHAAVNKIAAQRLAALATANETPPLLHLAHHIIHPSDRALIGRMNLPSYGGGSSYGHVHPNTRNPIVMSPRYTEERAASEGTEVKTVVVTEVVVREVVPALLVVADMGVAV